MKTRNRILGRIFLLFFVTALCCHSAYSQRWLNEVAHAMNLTQQRNDDKQVVLVAYKHLGALETQQDKLAVVEDRKSVV